MKKKYTFIALFLIIIIGTLFFEYYYFNNNKFVGEFTTITDSGTNSIKMDDSSVKHDFISTEDIISGFVVKMSRTNILEPSDLTISFSYDNQIVKEWKVTEYDINDQFYILMLDEPLHSVKGKKMSISFDCNGDTGIVIEVSPQSIGETYIDGNLLSNSGICLSVMKKPIKDRVLLIIYMGTVFFLGIIAVCIYKKLAVDKLFLICYLFLGIAQLFAVPIFKTPDENVHFFRAYEISMGHLVSKIKSVQDEQGKEELVVGREMPQAICLDNYMQKIGSPYLKLYRLKEAYQYTLDDGKTEFVRFPTSALYAPGSYLPQAIGIAIGRIFTNKVIIIAYFARLFNWLISGILVFLAIRYIPIGKNLLFLIALIPMNVQQFNSMSPDAFTFALCVDIIAFVLCQRNQQVGKLTYKHYFITYILVILLCQCKIVYVPFCLLLFLIPIEKFQNKKIYVVNIMLVAILIISICLGWLSISSQFLLEIQPGVDSNSQMLWLVEHPLQYIKIIINTLDKNIDSWIWGALGQTLGWLNINTSYIVLLMYGCLLLAMYILDDGIEKICFTGNIRIAFFTVSLIIVLLIMTSLYMQWTPVQMSIVQGIQGRYYIPLFFPVLLSLKPIIKENHDREKKYVYILAMSANLCIATILLSYAI